MKINGLKFDSCISMSPECNHLLRHCTTSILSYLARLSGEYSVSWPCFISESFSFLWKPRSAHREWSAKQSAFELQSPD